MSAANPFQHAPANEAPAGIGAHGAAAYDKSGILRDYAVRYGCRTCVETGLYMGAGSGMPLAAAGVVERYVAIDYQEENARLGALRVPDGLFVVGDSAVLMPDVLDMLEVGSLRLPFLFWLDAHAISEDEPAPSICPLRGELDAIGRWEHGPSSVVLIDDLWGMGTIPGWPTLAELREQVATIGYWDVDEEGGIMRLTPLSAAPGSSSLGAAT